MWRHVEASQFVFSDKGNMSEIEREDCGKTSMTKSFRTAYSTTLKYYMLIS